MITRHRIRQLFDRNSRRSSIRPQPRLEVLEGRLLMAVDLTYGGPGTVLSLVEQASGNTPIVTISERGPGDLEIDLVGGTFAATSSKVAGLRYQVADSPAESHFLDVNISEANNVSTLEAKLPGATIRVGVNANTSGGLGNVHVSAGSITVTGLDTSHAVAGGGNVELIASGGLTVAYNAQLNSGMGTISLAADVNADGVGNSNTSKLSIKSGARVVSENASSNAITLRGASVDIDTSAIPGVVGSPRADLSSTPSATLTGVTAPAALAFDGSSNLFVSNYNLGTVSEFAPGSTIPTATLLKAPQNAGSLAVDSSGDLFVASASLNTVTEFTPGSTYPAAFLDGVNDPAAMAFDSSGDLFVVSGVNNSVSEFTPGSTFPTTTLSGLSTPDALAFDSRGDLFVANAVGDTVSEFAPGSTTPTSTLTGLSDPAILAFDAHGDLLVANLRGSTVSEFAPGSTTPTGTLTGLSGPVAMAVDARGHVFVSNDDGATVTEFAPGSTTPTATLKGLNGPGALAVDAAGDLFVANVDGTVSEFAAVPSAGGVVIRTALPGESISVNDPAGTGLHVSNAELAQIKTSASGVITFGSRLHTGTITFSATTNLTNVVALQSPTGAGAIVLDDAHGSALNDVTGTVSLSAGTDGITATGGGSAATIVATGRVTLDTKGAVGSSTRPIVVDAPRSLASVLVGDIIAPASGVYLKSPGTLTLDGVDTSNAPLEVGAGNSLTVGGTIKSSDATLSAASLTVNAGASVTTSRNSADSITVAADTLTLLGTISASEGLVTLKPLTTNRNIDIGGTGPTADLVIGDSDLGAVTAAALEIGDRTADTGNIAVTGNVDVHPGYKLITLQTRKGTINSAAAATITVGALALQAGAGIGTTGDLHTAVGQLAFENESGAVHISNIGSVDVMPVFPVGESIIPNDIWSSSVVGSVFTILHTNAAVNEVSLRGKGPLFDGSTLTLADGNRYQINFKANGGQDVTLTRVADDAKVSAR